MSVKGLDVVYPEQQVHKRSEIYAYRSSSHSLSMQKEHRGIHYAIPDGRVIPFCSYNTLHREDVERKFSVPLEEWEQSHDDH